MARMLDELVGAWKARHAPRIAAWQASGRPYTGRFAPSPTGPLHQGSLVAALASWLDARAHGGRWLLRIEDLDRPREAPGATHAIMDALARLGLTWDGEVLLQSDRDAAYRAAFERLESQGLVYPCACTRREIADSVATRREHAFGLELVYPGTCRAGLTPGRQARAWRVRVPDAAIEFEDAIGGRQCQNLAREVGDFVLLRADGQWAYQIAVVVDDAAQGVTHVVRGADLIDSTARQLHLIRALGMARPQYLHVPLVTDGQGRKLSKQTGATALCDENADSALRTAWRHLSG